MLEEVALGAASGDGVAPGEDTERGDGMEGEGEEIGGLHGLMLHFRQTGETLAATRYG